MTTRQGNIYSIGPGWRVGCLVVLAVVWLALVPGQALAQCSAPGGAGDEYCENIPGAGGDRGPAAAPQSGGVPARTSGALDRADASALRRVESPRKHRRRAATRANATAPAGTAAPAPNIESGDGTALPYILGALTLLLLLAALVRRLRGSSPAAEDPAP